MTGPIDDDRDETEAPPTSQAAPEQPTPEQLQDTPIDQLLAMAKQRDPVLAELARRLREENRPASTDAAAFIAAMPDPVRKAAFGTDPAAAVRQLERNAELLRKGAAALDESPPEDLYDRAFRLQFGKSVKDMADSLAARNRHHVASGARPTERQPGPDAAEAAVERRMRELGIAGF